MKKLFAIGIFCILSAHSVWSQNCADQIDYMQTSFPTPPVVMPPMTSGITYNEVRTIAVTTHIGMEPMCPYTITSILLDTANCTGGAVPPTYDAQWEMYDDQGQQMFVGDTVNFDYNLAHKFFCLRLKCSNPPTVIANPYEAWYKIGMEIIPTGNCSTPIQTVLELPFRVIIQDSSNSNTVLNYPVQGYLFLDSDSDCVYGSTDQTVSSGTSATNVFALLKITNNGTQVVSYQNVYGDGYFHMNLSDGNYTLEPVTTNPMLVPSDCFPMTTIQVNNAFSQQVNFPMRYIPGMNCPFVDVSMTTSAQNRCFPTNSYYINCSNFGNEPASGQLVVSFPPEVYVLQSSQAPSNIAGHTYIYDIVNLMPNDYFQANFIDSIDCNSRAITLCPKGEFLPYNSCVPPSAQWDGSNVEVSGFCEGSQLRFVVRNASGNSMTGASQYRVYKNGNLLGQPESFQLSANDSLVLFFPSSDNETFHVEADQTPHHPRISIPRFFVEGCGPGPAYTLGHVASVQQDDIDGDVDICCIVANASYDPNDKQVMPLGETEIHAITRRDELQYTIRFQNTGTGPAYTVRVEDHLDLAKLDINTLILGAASHHYTFSISGQGEAVWTFPQIALPDSASDPAGSMGVFTFRIKQKGLLPWGTVINNAASIYFDSNPAIVTNTTFNTVDSLFKYNTSINEFSTKSFNVYPNPTNGFITMDLQQLKIKGDIEIKIINLNGQTVFSQTRACSGEVQLDCSGFAAGIYYIQISDANYRSYRSKFIKR